ncbi:GvpL/GvpF family gas vesicle protein [Streptomyces bauhiniae]|uniref:GvpL/GvpF family gas vesicle protein n=1 Tax=Streptomyces bauhiniae TaxID=2340725 RepID=A0A7K3QS03_9ACTN|nr:GvpL/GvpF family gas vesicle protein [Streptomyces bauhiniae]NEB92689.1 GvpL/GvpF family gas vesicle protein [Streptomyces bauhiniae]
MATYVYAITPARHPLRLEDLRGVGPEGSDLRVVSTEELSAVVSSAPEGLRAKRRDLVAHEDVLARLTADGAALPMRFGLVGPDDDQVRAALRENEDSYLRRLEELDGRVEFNLKVTRDEDDLLRDIVRENAEVRRLNEETRRDAGAHDARVRLGELISHEMQERRHGTGEEIVRALRPTAVRTAGAEAAPPHFLNVSFLVERAGAEAFSEAVHRDAEARGDAYTYHLHGPLPAYSFVEEG